MRNHSHENDFDLHENETACRSHFHVKGFTVRLVLKHKRHTRELVNGLFERHSGSIKEGRVVFICGKYQSFEMIS